MFEFSDSANYSMPAHFGGVEGQPKACTYDDVTSLLMREQHPGQAHIIKSLSELPIMAFLTCEMTHARQVLRVDAARQLP